MKSNLSSPLPRFFVTGLEPGIQYKTSLYSYNAKGRSEPIVLQTSTLKLPEKQHTQEKGRYLLADKGPNSSLAWFGQSKKPPFLPEILAEPFKLITPFSQKFLRHPLLKHSFI